MKTDNIRPALNTATMLRARIEEAHATVTNSNPLMAILLLDLIGQSAQIAQRLAEITSAMESMP